MAEISRSALFGKLNPVCYRAIESATVFCKMRGNPYVELVHWIHQLLQLQDSDLHQIARHFEIDLSKLAKDIVQQLDQLPAGATSISDLSQHVEDAVERAWVFGTLLFNESQIRSGHLIVGLLKTSPLRNELISLSNHFASIKLEQLTDQFQHITAQSVEQHLKAHDGFQANAEPGEASQALHKTPQHQALQQFTVDLTEQAEKGTLEPIVGRDQEIRQLIDILMRRRQNNPILTGEAGVGKTAVVEGFAYRIATGNVPPSLQNVRLRVLDIGLLQAGASMKGEFENRLKQVIEAVQSSERPIILFIDEAHTLVGAGGAAGTGDAANLLKPALARGNLRTIAATTWAEYKKHIEKDPALTRRFQVVKVDEPSENNAITMMRSLVGKMEQHHQVQILDEALIAAVKLSKRYIQDRQLPDKCVSLLDTAAARVAISQHATPADIEYQQRKISALETELAIIDREQRAGVDTQQRATDAKRALEQHQQQLQQLEQHWQQEQQLVTELLTLRQALREQDAADTTDTEATLTQLKQQQQALNDMQGESPLILPSVDYQAVAAVVADWTGIPVGKMLKNEIQAVLTLSSQLQQRVLGQDHALDMISKRVQTARAGLDNPQKPVGVFLLAGPSGVGKTETAIALAETLYGGEQNLITINMSEFQEAHTVSTLKGAPPGYVGYGEGGILTEAVRRKPYSVILLDEVEKAHPDVHEIFFQVFDKGQMEDGEGRLIDFSNTLILLTSNVGSELIMQHCQDEEPRANIDQLNKLLRQPLLREFPAALLGRLISIPYFPLNDNMMDNIIQLQLQRVQQRLTEHQNIQLQYTDDVIALIRARCQESESGARAIDQILTNTILPTISQHYLTRLSENDTIQHIQIAVIDDEFDYQFQ